MKVESIAECILQYFWHALSDNWYWKPILVSLRVAVLHRFYRNHSYRKVICFRLQLNIGTDRIARLFTVWSRTVFIVHGFSE